MTATVLGGPAATWETSRIRSNLFRVSIVLRNTIIMVADGGRSPRNAGGEGMFVKRR